MEVTRRYLIAAVGHDIIKSPVSHYETKTVFRNIEVSITHEDSDTIGSIILKARDKINNCDAILNIWEL